ncbi:MAG: hypothetical protein IJE43_13710 [Alphaproteobacteria bacterium]|nr:hypothetical protein [Alphaproteobacteria bacterium]
MSIINSWNFTRTVIDWEKFSQATHNQYRVVSSRPYVDKKGVLPNGVNLTLQVIKDDFDYGVDKEGKPRENNLFQNFDVTVLNNNFNITDCILMYLPTNSTGEPFTWSSADIYYSYEVAQ